MGTSEVLKFKMVGVNLFVFLKKGCVCVGGHRGFKKMYLIIQLALYSLQKQLQKVENPVTTRLCISFFRVHAYMYACMRVSF